MDQAGRPRVLLPLVGAALLVVIALALLAPGLRGTRPSGTQAQGAAPAASAPAAPDAERQSAAVGSPAGEPSALPSASAIGTPSGTGTASEVPPSGAPAAADGPAADARIEAEFVANHPGDLSAQDAAQVRELAVRVWTAETTGEGREQFPSYFPPAGTPLRPYTQVRMQAFSAHTAEGRVIVQLLWAGADPSGAYQDRRPGMLAVTRTATGWEPVR